MKRTTLLAASFVIIFMQQPAWPEQPTVQAPALSAADVFSKVKNSVVLVYTQRGERIAQGSGVTIGVEEVVTNCHVVKTAEAIVVGQGQQFHPAQLIHSDEERDLCALRVPGLSAPAVIIGSSRNLRVGQRVYAIGAPRGLELTLSEGLISSLRPYGSSYVIQTSAPLSPGSSGGGLFDEQGKLIGITTLEVVEGQNLNFAVPADWITELSRRGPAFSGYERLAADNLHKAIALDRRKDWAALLQLAKHWTVDQPKNGVAWFFLGRARGGLSQNQAAISAYRTAVGLGPEDVAALAWTEIGASYVIDQMPEAAVSALNESLRLHPQDPKALFFLGMAYLELGNRQKAWQVYEVLRNLDPEWAERLYKALQ